MDAANRDDPQAVSHYAVAIFEYLREAEVGSIPACSGGVLGIWSLYGVFATPQSPGNLHVPSTLTAHSCPAPQLLRRPNANYLASQPEINAKMRTILVDWLVEVSEEYRMVPDTLYHAVSNLDRVLSGQRVARSQLQLVGITCMWIAAKYEEIYPPNVSEFSYITDNTYSREELVSMEEEVLKKLKYELTVPTPKTFLRRLLQVCGGALRVRKGDVGRCRQAAARGKHTAKADPNPIYIRISSHCVWCWPRCCTFGGGEVLVSLAANVANTSQLAPTTHAANAFAAPTAFLRLPSLPPYPRRRRCAARTTSCTSCPTT